MAFRRFSRSRFSGRSLPAKKAFRTFSRKKLNWVTCYNQVCSADQWDVEACDCSDPDDCSPPPGTVIPLLTGSTAIVGGYPYVSLGEDSVIVRRLSGKLLIAALPNNLSTFTGVVNMRMGLAITRVDSTGVGPTYNPLDGDVASGEGDYANSGWLKMWERMWYAPVQRTALPPPVVWKPILKDCADVTEMCVTSQALTDGSGRTWDSGPPPAGTGVHSLRLSGECFTCEEINQTQITQQVNPHWVVPVTFRRPLRLRENQVLSLYIGVSYPDGGLTPNPLIGFVSGGVRALLEK